MNIIRKEREGIERNQMDFGGWNMISDIKISFEETNRLDIAGKKPQWTRKTAISCQNWSTQRKRERKTIWIVPLWPVGQHHIVYLIHVQFQSQKGIRKTFE